MSYTPINWQNGDTITAEKMNKMDNGWSVGETQILSETVITALGDSSNNMIAFIPTNSGYSAQFNANGIFTVLFY